jgi:hypothetical protein
VTPDDPNGEPVVLESAMDTGSEDGEPGERPGAGPLSADERALLDRLTGDERPDVVRDAPEDSPAAARAVADDTVLPEATPAGGDPDEPEFREPSATG